MASVERLRGLRTIAKSVILAGGGFAFVKDHFVDVTPINGRSMNPSLSPAVGETGQRDYVIWKMWKATEGLKIGDVVLFTNPSNAESGVVKRIIATGGDVVTLDPKRRPGYGQDPMSREDTADAARWDSYQGSLIVPYGHVWVEGDNTSPNQSRDSNYYGPVSRNLVLGKAWKCIWPWPRCLTQPWETFQGATAVQKREEVLPQMWLD